MTDSDFKKRMDAKEHRFKVDDKAEAEKARLAIAKQVRDNAANLGTLRRDYAQAAAFARATAENLKNIDEAKVATKQAEVDRATTKLASSKARYEAAAKLKSANDADHFYETLIAVGKAYPNGVPKETVHIIGTVFADVVDRNDVKEQWAAFKASNNASLTVTTNTEELHLKKVIDEAHLEVARVSTLFQELAEIKQELVNTGINPLNPTEYKINGKGTTKEKYEAIKKEYGDINKRLIAKASKIREALDKITSKIDGPLSLETAVLVRPLTILKKLMNSGHDNDVSTNNSAYILFNKNIDKEISYLDSKLGEIQNSIDNQFNNGVPNPVFGVNNWIVLKSTNLEHPPLYYNQATKISTLKAPSVFSIYDFAFTNGFTNKTEIGKLQTVPVAEGVYKEIIKQSPPFKDSAGLVPIIQTNFSSPNQEIKMPDGTVIRPELKYNKEDSLKEEKEFFDDQRIWEGILETDKKALIAAKEKAKTDPSITATQIMGAPDFVKEWARLSTPDAAGNIPAQNNSQLLEIVKFLSSSRYGEQINTSLQDIDEKIKDFKEFKNKEKDPAKIAKEAAEVNASIIESIKIIEATFPLLDEATRNKAIEAIKPKDARKFPLSQVAPSGTSNTATTASNDTPASTSTDAEATPVDSKVAVQSVSASTSSSDTPTSASTESGKGQEVDEETGELIQSEDEEGEDPTHASWKNLPAIIEKSTPYSIASAPEKGVEMDASKPDLFKWIHSELDRHEQEKAAEKAAFIEKYKPLLDDAINKNKAGREKLLKRLGIPIDKKDLKENLPAYPMTKEKVDTIIEDSKGKPNMVTSEDPAAKELLLNSSVPLEADAAIAKANASTEVPTPLKSIPASDPASAIKIQNDMDNKDEEDDVATTDSIKNTTAPTAVKKSTSSK